MPYRKEPLVTGEIYHVFNRSIARQPIFNNTYDYERVLQLINYYRFNKLPLRFSFYKRLSKELKEQYTEKYIIKNEPMLKVMAYCIMPTHFHFLLQPLSDNAISNFMRNFQNGYSKYFNLKYGRTGSLFQSMFKAVRIETDEQLVHVSRYIHINPTTAHIIDVNQLELYPWSSLQEYLSEFPSSSFIYKQQVLNHFRSPREYKAFILDQVDYQRELDKIKHLLLT